MHLSGRPRIPQAHSGTQSGSISGIMSGISSSIRGISESTSAILTIHAFFGTRLSSEYGLQLFHTAYQSFLHAFKFPSSIRDEGNAPIVESEHYETYRLRFLAPEIIETLYYKYFDGVRMREVKDPEFPVRNTPTFICLISTAIWHGIRAWLTGTYVKPDHFQSQNESVVKTFNRMSNTWKGRSRQNHKATLEVIKDNLREKVVHAQLRGIGAEEEGEEHEEEDLEGGEEEDL
ncbi:hypothetical protein DFP73DRAFT_528150 [Morchella snyderi]|nr:hypothetical protein DFP73DRAFT_528150 [Morchella snyderi]